MPSHRSLLQLAATVFGAVFVAVAVIGFVQGDTVLGVFEVDALHNVIHLASGLAALAAASSGRTSRLYFLGFGAVYALVAAIGFVDGDTVLGLFDVNAADNVLHLVIAAATLALGLALSDEPRGASRGRAPAVAG